MTDTIARVHRFRNMVAARVGNGETTYFTPKQAKQLARALNKCAKNVGEVKFVDSSFGDVEVEK